ncbi:MAG: (2Fe-2S) ferredoxin domain-containing protein, partial [Lentisphaerae bacterium]|nr:(2Fe-2S) ferredoxin domain-containing protein [Lentisphaerota bacterium]
MAYKYYVLICGGTACDSNDGLRLTEALKKEIELAGLAGEAQIVRTGCLGFCEKGPIVKIL